MRALGNSIKDLEKSHGSWANMHIKEQQFVKIENLSVPLLRALLAAFQVRAKLPYKNTGEKPSKQTCDDIFTKVSISS